MGEFDFIAWLRRRTPADPRVLVGPGDDCAVLAPPARPLLVTTDMLMDGTDFVLADVGGRAAGRKAMAVNLSDIAAMAGVPTFAVVSVALPRNVGASSGVGREVGRREHPSPLAGEGRGEGVDGVAGASADGTPSPSIPAPGHARVVPPSPTPPPQGGRGDSAPDPLGWVSSHTVSREVGRRGHPSPLAGEGRGWGEGVDGVTGASPDGTTPRPSAPAPGDVRVVPPTPTPPPQGGRGDSAPGPHAPADDIGVSHAGAALARDLDAGLRDTAAEYGVAVVGGDTNSWDGRLVVSVTLFGEATARGPVTRGGARPGDWVMLTGPVGGSIRGRHLTPAPRVREAQQLHAVADLHAMIDISDGLAADLNHILEESRCGAVLDAATIPVHPDAVELARATGRPPLAHALGDGEDFELIFAVPPADGARLLRDQPIPGLTLAKIGEFVDAGLWLEENGARRPLCPTGWVHAL